MCLSKEEEKLFVFSADQLIDDGLLLFLSEDLRFLPCDFSLCTSSSPILSNSIQ